MTRERIDPLTLRVFGGLLVGLCLLFPSGMALLGSYIHARNAYDECELVEPPDGALQYEAAYADSGATLVPIGVFCDYNMVDGTVLHTLQPDWGSTFAAILGLGGVIGGIAMLSIAAQRQYG